MISPKDQIVKIQEQMSTCSNLLEVKDIVLGKVEQYFGGSREFKGGMSVEKSGSLETVSTTEKVNQHVEKAEIPTLETPKILEDEEHISGFVNDTEVVGEKGEVNEKINVTQYDEKIVDSSVTVIPVSLVHEEETITLHKDQTAVSKEKMASYSNLREQNDFEINGELDSGVDNPELIGGGVGLSETLTNWIKLTQVAVKSKIPSLEVKTSNNLVNMKSEEQISELKDITETLSQKADATENIHITTDQN